MDDINKTYLELKPKNLSPDSFSVLELRIRIDKLHNSYMKSVFYKHFLQLSRINNNLDRKVILQGLWYAYIIKDIDSDSMKALFKRTITPEMFISRRIELIEERPRTKLLYNFHEWLKNFIMLTNTNNNKFGSIISLSHSGMSLLNELTFIQYSNDHFGISMFYNVAKSNNIALGNKYLKADKKSKNKDHYNKKYSNEIVNDFIRLKNKGIKHEKILEELIKTYPQNKHLKAAKLRSFCRAMYYRI